MSLAAERADPFRVLIVDDDAAHRGLVSEILSAPLFSVSAAMSGRIALELLCQNEFDVVLVNKVMPEMSGDELCQAIRQRYNRHILPVIVVCDGLARLCRLEHQSRRRRQRLHSANPTIPTN